MVTRVRSSLFVKTIKHSEKPFSVSLGSTLSWLNVKSLRPLVGMLVMLSTIVTT